jgi:peptidoglycan/xylan/chitin deacetylase (PgdA/CDA1 family)
MIRRFFPASAAAIILVAFAIQGCAHTPGTIAEKKPASVSPTAVIGAPPASAGNGVLERELGNGFAVDTWNGGRRSALSLTFDDAMENQYLYAKDILRKYGITASFFLNTGYVGDTSWKWGTWDEFRAIAAEGHEIGAHMVTHPWPTKIPYGSEDQKGSLLYELSKSKADVEREIPGQKCLTMSYPFSDHSAQVVEAVRARYLSARTGFLDATTPEWNAQTPVDWGRLVSYVPWFPDPRSRDGDKLELERTERLLAASVSRERWALLMIHSVVPLKKVHDNNGFMPVTPEWLAGLCAWAKDQVDRGNIWAAPQGTVTRYILERDALTATVTARTDTSIIANFSTGLDASIFTVPVSITFTIPASWSPEGGIPAVTVTHDGATIPSTIIGGSTGYRVRFETRPDVGEIMVENGRQPR